ncbi:MAG: Holliday junction branch migration protein RuvA [Planctomycetota bacterium]|nr:Holliday junction branch migration protein RuvA [Planctomycetota bacterium]MDI6786858.1 Holliday junction branch migration protein RuvA [Planctomycetota bacterium]
MIEYISGELKSKSPATAIIELNGIAYRLYIPHSTYEKLPDKGIVSFYTDLVIHSGMQGPGELRIYGFYSKEERQVFQLLCSVTRVGPLLALRILSGSSIAQIKHAVVSNDVDFLSRIKGVGNKTAQRIGIELKEAFADLEISGEPVKTTEQSTVITEAVLVLVALGYQRNIAEKSVRQILQKPITELTTENIVKEVLKTI